MKIAVLYSGQYRDYLNVPILLEEHNRIFEKLPHEVHKFYSTWNTCKSHIPEILYFEEPNIDYNPVLDVHFKDHGEKWSQMKSLAGDNDSFKAPPKSLLGNYKWLNKSRNKNTFLNGTKQILAHSFIFDSIAGFEYDCIIRMRWDIKIKNEFDMNFFIEESITHNKAIGIGKYFINRSIENKYLADNIIIHPPELFNSKLVYELTEKKQLRFAEWGWYQILGEPYDDTHSSYLSKDLIP